MLVLLKILASSYVEPKSPVLVQLCQQGSHSRAGGSSLAVELHGGYIGAGILNRIVPSECEERQ